jgi:Raf kinase inhibitor-like YbhB/YbcL family protein
MKPLVLGLGIARDRGYMRSQVLTNVLKMGVVFGLSGSLFSCRVPATSPGASPIAPEITLTSSAFAAGEAIPAAQSCDGKNLSPDLAWDSVPPDTQSLALIAEDPDTLFKPFTHWVLYDLPPSTRQLPAGLPSQPFLTIGGGQGKNDFKRYGYGGPCPPKGSTHRYVFRLYALDKLLDLPAGATKAEVLEAIEGHVKATGELMGKYTREK